MTIAVDAKPGGGPAAFLRLATLLLVAIVWISAGLFGAYIFAFYAGAVPAHALGRWNENLPGIYAAGHAAATAAIGFHFLTGAVLLLLGPIQLIGRVRRRWPALHRWLGRIYIGAAFLTGLGGLGFIAAKGTIGGAWMNMGFGLYGALMVGISVLAYLSARARRIETHRAWAIRLFALAIGSWLYRMDYGFWLSLVGRAGHTADFRGAFDLVMAYAFYVPNLVVAEIFMRARGVQAGPVAKIGAGLVLLGVAGFLLMGTYYFTSQYWGPAILAAL